MDIRNTCPRSLEWMPNHLLNKAKTCPWSTEFFLAAIVFVIIVHTAARLSLSEALATPYLSLLFILLLFLLIRDSLLFWCMVDVTRGRVQALHTSWGYTPIFASPGTSPKGIRSTRSLGASFPSCKFARFFLPTPIGLCLSFYAGLCSSTPTRVFSADPFIIQHPFFEKWILQPFRRQTQAAKVLSYRGKRDLSFQYLQTHAPYVLLTISPGNRSYWKERQPIPLPTLKREARVAIFLSLTWSTNHLPLSSLSRTINLSRHPVYIKARRLRRALAKGLGPLGREPAKCTWPYSCWEH